MRNFVLTLAVATGLVACGSSDFESTEVRPTTTVEASASTETPATSEVSASEDRFRNPDFQTTATPAPAPTPAPTENAIDRAVNSAPVSREATR